MPRSKTPNNKTEAPLHIRGKGGKPISPLEQLGNLCDALNADELSGEPDIEWGSRPAEDILRDAINEAQQRTSKKPDGWTKQVTQEKKKQHRDSKRVK